MKITRTWLQDQFDEDLLEHGERCFLNGHVGNMEVLDQGRIINGEVEGAGRYSVYIEIDEFGVDGDCSCSVGYNCEHVAALLLARIAGQNATFNGEQPDHGEAPIHTISTHHLPDEITAVVRQQLTCNDYPADVHQRILYIFRPESDSAHIRVHVMSAKRLKNGAYGTLKPFHLSNLGKHVRHRFIMPVDAHILQCIEERNRDIDSFLPTGSNAAEMMALLLKSERCYWLDANQPALKSGGNRPGSWQWQFDEEARQHLRLNLISSPNPSPILPTSPPMYVDTDAGLCGAIQTDCPDHLCERLLFTPAIEPDDPLPLGGISFDWPSGIAKPEALHLRRSNKQPIPVLQLISVEENGADGMRMMFDYGGRLLPLFHGAQQVYYRQENQWWVTAADPGAEMDFLQPLYSLGLVFNPVFESSTESSAQALAENIPHWLLPNSVKKAHETDWSAFFTTTMPILRQAGFRVITAPGFRYEIVQVRQWDVGCKEHGIMGEIYFEVVIDDDGHDLHIDLIDVIATWVDAEPERLSESSLMQLAKSGAQYLPLPDGRMLPIAGEMLHGMLIAMLDMFSMTTNHLATNHVTPYNTTATQWLALRDALTKSHKDSPYIHIQDDAAWRDRMRQLTESRKLPEVIPPTGLKLSLRDYQQHGLNWLQHLRRLDLGALLADDMGLGKTIQTLAHMLKEKETGALSSPALVVAPTSLMHNWQAEAARFTPDLKVLLLHGSDRKASFSRLEHYDLVLTTYALLHRDGHVLKRRHWSMFILDEAQNIRNPRTHAARAARELEADQRICLTGTPMENHLGELWALFDFLMPAYLSDIRTFSRCFRKPIEQERDSNRQTLLNLRIRPFMLRRNKDEVAAELPEKTDIIRTVEMGDTQRELYEGIRLLMHQKVRDAMQRMGKGQSHIIVLDALLKMRQVCCDPRLLKHALLDKKLPDAKAETATASAITLESIDKAGSAKLDMLRQMLPEMIAEGRRILLFSQFTRMLNIIAALCDELSIPYVTLTGATRNRAIPVEAFQNHEAPLFLISLKAGGVGLNLAAADSVIHYDPWWNPAAEAQASDRAHRIGQDKPVFVYKLITGGSVESRILDMQMRKKKLADALYKGSKQGSPVWSDAELESLFAPLEE